MKKLFFIFLPLKSLNIYTPQLKFKLFIDDIRIGIFLCKQDDDKIDGRSYKRKDSNKRNNDTKTPKKYLL